MKIKDILDKIKLVDIQNSLDTDQIGAVNIKVENNTYIYNIPDSGKVEKLRTTTITDDIETKIKQDAEKRLLNIEPSLELLSDKTRNEVVIAQTTASALNIIKDIE